MKIPHFCIDVFNARIYVCSTRAEFDACMKRLGAEYESHMSAGAGVSAEVAHVGCASHVLAVFDGTVDTLAHEASHIVDLVLKRKGVHGEVDTEVRAYLMGYVTGKAAHLLRGMKWPKRPR
jgi:hypothetical protein